ncbi:MAG: AMP-binding protein [Planctomycetes bacterium]|nr:AMP-binding protein [Planctomycetota bacterium]
MSPDTDNIAAALPAMARAQPDAAAVVFARDGRTWSFAELDAESDRLAHGLATEGVGRGVRTVLMVPPGPAFFALAFALFKVGAVPVVVDPGMGTRRLGRCLGEAEPEAFVGIAKAHVARALLGWARGSLRVRVAVGGLRLPGALSWRGLRARGAGGGPYPPALARGAEAAAILFTSGSTGPPKGVVYTHGIFAAQVELLRRTYGIRPGEVDLVTFPLFALFDPALGMTAVVPEMDFTRPGRVVPARILEPIRRYRVTNLFGSPALLDRVSRHGAAAGARLESLRRVISAGAPVSPKVLARMAAMLPEGTEVHTPYGATEALPVTSIASREILGETAARAVAGAGVCVGRPVAGVEVAIVPITDEAVACWNEGLRLPAGEIGEIAVRGPVVTRAYYNRPAETRLAKIPDARGDGFFHRMGDVGYRDDSGRVWFCGRKAHRVRTAAGTLFSVACEGVFNAHPAVRRTALVGVGAAGAARPVLCVELEAGVRRRERGRIEAELLALGAAQPRTASIRTVRFVRAFPVDVRHNAKISRERLAAWAARRRR